MKLPSVFTEMLASLVTLGETQNLAKTTQLLGVSRQTIRRHIRELEHIKGQTFFDTSLRRYELTPDGAAAVFEAKKLGKLAGDWVNNQQHAQNGLLNVEIDIDHDSWVYAQQHPINHIWSDAPPIIQRGLQCWAQAEDNLEHRAFEKIRPYMLVYRKYRGEWLIVEVGEKSAYSTWLGSAVAKSELGRKLDLGEKFDIAIEHWRRPYQAVLENGSLWYEHIGVALPRDVGEASVPVNYQRLVAACRFPDGQPAVLVFAARTDRIDIPNMPRGRLKLNLPENLMDFDI